MGNDPETSTGTPGTSTVCVVGRAHYHTGQSSYRSSVCSWGRLNYCGQRFGWRYALTNIFIAVQWQQQNSACVFIIGDRRQAGDLPEYYLCIMSPTLPLLVPHISLQSPEVTVVASQIVALWSCLRQQEWLVNCVTNGEELPFQSLWVLWC
jgi:hypothetical protein